MKPIKRVEIVVGSVDIRRVRKLLEAEGLKQYTVIPQVTGRGSSYDRDADGLTTVFSNSYLILACSDEELERIKEPLRELLKRLGGVCVVSDAQWLMH
ncbi:MAG TPA: transcriptional regulator [Cytophagales bacterium]|nr:transcriptional regulator [Cytophagales bacterium]HAA23659.1 transcriptional regulator [Cytophagales bacterium]HAP59265.1 transcriptional regulator [Cytophagales bacterium]